MPLKWSREDARCKDAVVFTSDNHCSSCYLILPEALKTLTGIHLVTQAIANIFKF